MCNKYIPKSMNEKTYSTRQLGEAAALVSLGHPVLTIDLEYDRGNVVGYFFFADSEDLQNDVKECLNRNVKIEYNEFLSNLRSLKSQVSNHERTRSLGR